MDGIPMIWELAYVSIGMCVSTEQGWLHGCVTCAVTQGLAPEKGPLLYSWPSWFLNCFKQEPQRFSFALGPTNCVAEICLGSQTF